MMMVYLCYFVNPDNLTQGNSVKNVDSRILLKANYLIVMTVGRHRRHPIETIGDEDGVKWAAEPLCMHHAYRVDEKSISTARAIKPNKIASISTEDVRPKATFTGPTQNMLSYTKAYEEH